MAGNMDVSTQLNHWIALTAELEDTRELIAKAIYKHYKAGRIVDESTCDICRKLDDLFRHAKEYEEQLAEDFKAYIDPDAVTKELGGEVKEKNMAAKARTKGVSFLTKYYIKWTIGNYRGHFRETYIELGQRAVNMVDNGQEICSDPKVVGLCRYAIKLRKDTDHRWEEIQILQRENVKGNIFVSLFQNFVISLTAFSKTQSSPFLKKLKLFKNDDQLQQKIREQYRKAMLTVYAGR